ncbi:MAG TPA: DUF6790 family protein [Rhodoblastus sp.]|nr:DUF6790 family protein [Rhodoblastus sp.]
MRIIGRSIRFFLENLPAFFFVGALVAAIFLFGDAVGHVRQMTATGDFAPGNAGLPFDMDAVFPLLTIVLLLLAKRAAGASHTR